MVCNSLLYLIILASSTSRFGQWEPLQVGFLWCAPFLLNTSLFSGITCSRLILNLPYSSPEISHFLKDPGFLLVGSSIWALRYATGVSASWLFQLTELWIHTCTHTHTQPHTNNIYIHTYIHVHIYLHIHIYIYFRNDAFTIPPPHKIFLGFLHSIFYVSAFSLRFWTSTTVNNNTS